ncbi:TetR/AcrR family transcriptional regulator [Dyella sp. C11]|uniref:TetR/AcrR family transcriptional regulator n=1 Tax=Dyella sp. C11 TaxID=2126991 RepID=UPI000D64CD67|nr:TetR/AcrR family transcriptional regulator [Dyella sp. C11]
MTSTTNRRSSKTNAEEHGAAQRTRILAAARQRFIEQGFHAATMESIAQQAGVSTGLSYRYFQNKRALVLAMIEQNLEEDRRNLQSLSPTASLAGFVDDLAMMFSQRDADARSAVLFSEITAAATRDPEIGKALEHAEAVAREDFIHWLKERDAAMGITSTIEELRVRELAMRCIFFGLIVRSTREPDQDVEQLKVMLRRVLPLVMHDDGT